MIIPNPGEKITTNKRVPRTMRRGPDSTVRTPQSEQRSPDKEQAVSRLTSGIGRSERNDNRPTNDEGMETRLTGESWSEQI